MARNNCACIVDAPWVTAEHIEAAGKWIDFVREDEQQRAFMRSGFRPVTDLPLTDPSSNISGEYGLDPSTPAAVLDVSLIDPPVSAAIDESWEDVKRSGLCRRRHCRRHGQKACSGRRGISGAGG